MSLAKLGQFQSLLSSCILHIMGKVIETDIDERDKLHLRECSALAAESRRKGNHPFAAQLVDEDGTVLMSQENGFTVGGSAYHAETLLTLRAAKEYGPEKLAKCTLYTNFEPCVMCMGAIYWANIGRLVYGVSERDLLALTGDNEENPTFSLSCRDVVKAGQKDIRIAGPTDDEELKAELLKTHEGFWS